MQITPLSVILFVIAVLLVFSTHPSAWDGLFRHGADDREMERLSTP